MQSQSQSVSSSVTTPLNAQETLNDAIRLNCKGVSLLQRGCYEDAIVVFSRAFKVSKRALQHCAEDDLRSANATISLCRGPKLFRPVAEDGFSRVAKRVFRQPFTILSNDCPQKLHQSTCLAASSLIVFNLALSLHLVALEKRKLNPAERTRNLQNAAILYQQGLEIKHKLGARVLGAVGQILFMAVLNNLQLVNRQLGKMERARFYLSKLKTFVISLEQEGLRTCKYFEFFSRASSSQFPRLVASAA